MPCQPSFTSGDRHGKVGPLQSESQFLLGKGVVVVRLDGVVVTAHAFVKRVADIACGRFFVQGALARKRVALVRLDTRHADWISISTVLHGYFRRAF